jgi:transposase-like protein
MTVDELFDAIEEKITNDGYVYTDLWKAYMIIGKFHKNLIFPPKMSVPSDTMSL